MDGVEATLSALYNEGHGGPVTEALKSIKAYKSKSSSVRAKGDIMDFQKIFQGAALDIIYVLVGVIIAVVGVLLIKLRTWIVGKIGASTYNRALELAYGMWFLLEDEFKHIEKAGELKRKKMEKLLLAQFPSLTQTELDAINKHIHNSIKQQLESTGILNPVEP